MVLISLALLLGARSRISERHETFGGMELSDGVSEGRIVDGSDPDSRLQWQGDLGAESSAVSLESAIESRSKALESLGLDENTTAKILNAETEIFDAMATMKSADGSELDESDLSAAEMEYSLLLSRTMNAEQLQAYRNFLKSQKSTIAVGTLRLKPTLLLDLASWETH